MSRFRLEILAIIAVVGYCALFLSTSSTMKTADFAGSDTVGSDQIAQLSGKTVDDYPPLIGQWVPPSGEIESALFAIQAAIGGILVGWVFGYWTGQKKGRAKG
ncbi:MAG: cobalt transport protein CbiN [Methanoregulaceae archaeon]|nr:cobalt transport protein CbiN [Methanoregulaceae archaeon]